MCCGDACLRKAPGLLHGLGLHDEKLIFLLSPFTDSLITLKKESIGISLILFFVVVEMLHFVKFLILYSMSDQIL